MLERSHHQRRFKCEFCHKKLPIGTENQHQEECPELIRVLNYNQPQSNIPCELCDVMLPVVLMNDHILAHLVDNETQSQETQARVRTEQSQNTQHREHIILRPDGREINILIQSNDGRPRSALMINPSHFIQPHPRHRLVAQSNQRPANPNKTRSFQVSRFRSDETVSCTICMENLKKKEKVKTLPCMHIFHPGCIDEWLLRSNQCPICKFQI